MSCYGTQWAGHFVDMIQPVSERYGCVRVFTPGGRFISGDCFHLTEDGAKYYAELLADEIDSIFREVAEGLKR